MQALFDAVMEYINTWLQCGPGKQMNEQIFMFLRAKSVFTFICCNFSVNLTIYELTEPICTY